MAFPEFAYTVCSLDRRRAAAISFITFPPLFQPLILLSPTPYTRSHVKSHTLRYCGSYWSPVVLGDQYDLLVAWVASDHKVNAIQKKSCQQPSTNVRINVTQNTPVVAASQGL